MKKSSDQMIKLASIIEDQDDFRAALKQYMWSSCKACHSRYRAPQLMKKYIFIFIVLFYADTSTHSHYPITRDSLEAIKNGKILYNQYCVSCHQANLAGATNWQGLDEDGHRKAPPLNGTGHTWHHTDELLHRMIKYGFAKLDKKL